MNSGGTSSGACRWQRWGAAALLLAIALVLLYLSLNAQSQLPRSPMGDESGGDVVQVELPRSVSTSSGRSVPLRTFTRSERGVVVATTADDHQLTLVDSCSDVFPTVDTSGFDSIVIEIGTNLYPETRKMSPFTAAYDEVPAMAQQWGVWKPARGRLRYFVTVDPLKNATASCLALSKVHRVVEGAVSPECGAISFYVDGTLSGVIESPTSTKVTVGAFPLSRLIASLRPKAQRVQLLLVDAQGFDEAVVMSSGEELDRVDNVVLECQDLPHGHPGMLSPLSGTCANASAALQGSGFQFGFCMPNLALAEKNCWFYHPRFVNQPHHAFEYPPVSVEVLRARRLNASTSAEGRAFPLPLLTMAGDLFRAMCVSLSRPIVFATLCAMGRLEWHDPANLTEPIAFPKRCAVFSIIAALGPSNRRSHSAKNKLAWINCNRSPTGYDTASATPPHPPPP